MGWGGASQRRRRKPTTHAANPKRLPSPPRGGDGGGGHALCQGLAVNRVQNQLHHTLDVTRHLWVPKTQNLKPLSRQPLIPPLVAFPTMPTSIDLDHQPSPQVGEIRNERPNRRLPPEMQPKHPIQLPQLRPDAPLLLRHLRPQLPCALPGDGVNAGHPSRPMPKAPHPNPPHKGEGEPSRLPPASIPTRKAPPLPLVGRGWGWGARGRNDTTTKSSFQLRCRQTFRRKPLSR